MGDRKVLLHNYEQAYDQYDSGSQGYDEDETSASILASVREQEEQFAKLTKEIEAERNTVTKQLQRSHNYAASLESISDTEESFPWRQHAAQSVSQVTEEVDGTVHSQSNLVDNTLRVFQPHANESTVRMNSDAYYDPDADSYVSEQTTRKEDYNDPLIQSETVVGDDGVTRTITKKTVTKTVTTHTTRKIEDYETDSIPRSNVSGRNNTRQPGSFRSDSQHSGSMPRQRGSPQEETKLLGPRRSSLSSSNSDVQAGNHASPVGYSKRNYDYDQDNRPLTPEKFQQEEYGLEDDRRSEYDDENEEYGLGPTENSRPMYQDKINYDHHSSGSSTPRNRYNDPVEEILQNTDQFEVPVAAPRSNQTPAYGRAPLAKMEAASQGSIDRLGHPNDGWTNPELAEVIKMLSYPMDVVQQNAAAYLQHLCFNDNNVKANVRRLGGIPILIKLLGHENPKVQLHACGSLRNLSYGPQNNENKQAIKNFEGVPALVTLTKTSINPIIKEHATGTLWNLSALKDLRGQIRELALEPLTNLVIVPHSGCNDRRSTKPKDVEMSDIFTNSVGVIRNLSSHDSVDYRRHLRECEGLIDAIVHFLRMSTEREEVENKATENCICVLRNLSYQLHKEAPGADTFAVENEPNQPEKSDTTCFGKKKAKAPEGDSVDQIPPSDPNAHGVELLWQPDIVRPYLYLLGHCLKFPEILEAAAGALQNLTHGSWQWSRYARAVVRKEKGLPVLVDRLRTDNDRVIRAVAIALTNLSQDYKNKELIGKYAMRDLAFKLPGESQGHVSLSDATYIAVLNTIRVVVEKSATNAQELREAGGIERITTVNNSRDSKYHPRVVKAAGQVLKALWDIKELHSMYKKDGWNKTHFTPTVTMATLPRNHGAMNNRPYEDAHESTSSYSKKDKMSEEYAMNEKNKKPAVRVGEKDGPADSWV